MYTFEYGSLHHSGQLCHVGYRENIQVFGTDHDIYRNILTKPLVYTFELRATETNEFIMNHCTIQDVTFSDKIRHERVDRLIININRRTYLLNLSFAHHNNRVAQRKRFFLVVSDVHKRNSQGFMHFLEFHLHILTHFQVKCRQRFIQK